MYCSKCGHKLEDDATFCPICGTNVNQSKDEKSESNPSNPSSSSSKPIDTQNRPTTNLIWAILTTLLCCFPLGIVSIVYAAKVDTLWLQGNYEESRLASRRAGQWAVWSAISAVILFISYFIYVTIIGVGIFSLLKGVGS